MRFDQHTLLALIVLAIFLSLFLLVYISIIRSGARPVTPTKTPYVNRVQSMIRWGVFCACVMLYLNLLHEMFSARHHGLGITAALITALARVGFDVLPVLGGVAIGVLLVFLLFRRRLQSETGKQYAALEPLDERFELVEGKASRTTLWIFAGILFIAGTLYEVLFHGVWPIRTFIELGLLVVIWVGVLQYWNQRC